MTSLSLSSVATTGCGVSFRPPYSLEQIVCGEKGLLCNACLKARVLTEGGCGRVHRPPFSLYSQKCTALDPCPECACVPA